MDMVRWKDYSDSMYILFTEGHNGDTEHRGRRSTSGTRQQQSEFMQELEQVRVHTVHAQ